MFWISGLLLTRVVAHCIHGGSTFVVFMIEADEADTLLPTN